VLGVCLGHQAIGQCFGGQIVRAPRVMHGKTSAIHHDGMGVYLGLPQPLVQTRYHSLVIDPASVPDVLDVTAWSHDVQGEPEAIMGVRHREWTVEGVQFHPESVLTPGGYQLLGNFLKLAGIDYNRNPPDQISVIRPTTHSATPANPGWPAKQPHQYQ